MRCHIANLSNDDYQGIDRWINDGEWVPMNPQQFREHNGALCFYKNGATYYDPQRYAEIFNLFIKYEEFNLRVDKDNGFNDTFKFYEYLRDYIPCEVIVYDIKPITNIEGFKLTFLGYEVVDEEMSESYFSELYSSMEEATAKLEVAKKERLHWHQLYDLEEDRNWVVCYVYRVEKQSQ